MSVPVWQPDSQASCCCLCSNKFTLFNRRHHCRKCGRVVCGDCSDQQIRYFASTMIVGPGNRQTRPTPYDTYRTCDECVEEIRMIRRALFDGVNIDQSIDSPRITGLTSSAAPGGGSENSPGETNSISSVTKYISTRTRTRLIHSSTQSSVNTTPKITAAEPSPQPPSDDDQSDHNLCPVCAINLSQLFKGSGNDDLETFKEEHINDCLTQFDFNFDHQRSPTADGSRLHTRNKMLVYNIPPIPKPQFETFPASSSSSSNAINTEAVPEFIVGSENSAHSTMQMSEKFVARECVICLEDLKPGDKVGRLECLCVFHYKCIKDWFNKKGYGECPVHFLHK